MCVVGTLPFALVSALAFILLSENEGAFLSDDIHLFILSVRPSSSARLFS